MFIVKLNYQAPLTEVDKYLQAHREFLEYHYRQGLFLASGPIQPRTGGILIAINTDRAHLQQVLSQDPFYLAEIANHEIIEFHPVLYRDEIKSLVKFKEGETC